MTPIPPRRILRANGATASLVLGIISVVSFGIIFSIPAIFLGHSALKDIRTYPGELTGRGEAVAGLWMGYIVTGVWAVIALFVGLAIYTGKVAKENVEKRSGELFSMTVYQIEKFPEITEFQTVGEEGVRVGQVRFPDAEGPGGSMQVRVYLPGGADDDTPGKYPCVLVAPAGTNLLTGMSLEALDENAYHDEALPYAEAGFVVVLYSIDGEMPEDVPEDEYGNAAKKAYNQFRDAGAGTLNGRNALDFALQKLPMVDPDRIFAAGHSSAGTLALLMASHEPRLRGVVAYAPCSDVEAQFSELLEESLVSLVYPGLRHFARQSSPMTHVGSMRAPLFLFYARDDSHISEESASEYINALRMHPTEVTIKKVSSGGHYYSMITDGIPAGIEWMKSQE